MAKRPAYRVQRPHRRRTKASGSPAGSNEHLTGACAPNNSPTTRSRWSIRRPIPRNTRVAPVTFGKVSAIRHRHFVRTQRLTHLRLYLRHRPATRLTPGIHTKSTSLAQPCPERLPNTKASGSPARAHHSVPAAFPSYPVKYRTRKDSGSPARYRSSVEYVEAHHSGHHRRSPATRARAKHARADGRNDQGLPPGTRTRGKPPAFHHPPL